MKRTLVLDEDDLVMVVGCDVVQRIDEKRGALTRTEFINFLIHQQLEARERGQSYVDREEFYSVIREMKTIMGSFLELLLSLGLVNQPEDEDYADWLRKVRSLSNSDT